MLLGCGHAIWGLAVYREPLREIVQERVVRSVGDGIFDSDHDRGPRAAGFWFLLAAPFMALSGYLLESALRSGAGCCAALASFAPGTLPLAARFSRYPCGL
jgi:hypothetical protein